MDSCGGRAAERSPVVSFEALEGVRAWFGGDGGRFFWAPEQARSREGRRGARGHEEVQLWQVTSFSRGPLLSIFPAHAHASSTFFALATGNGCG